MNKISFLINAWVAQALVTLIAMGCGGAPDPTSDSGDNINNSRQMPGEKEFNQIMENAGLPPRYIFDSLLLTEQSGFASAIPADLAFQKGIESLFSHNAPNKHADDFYMLVSSQPESFGLAGSPTDTEIHDVIVSQIRGDSGFGIFLLPEDPETRSPAGQKSFPPEQGETVKEYWIWYVKCSFFPGPAWILVKRDGTIPAYHYGYI